MPELKIRRPDEMVTAAKWGGGGGGGCLFQLNKVGNRAKTHACLLFFFSKCFSVFWSSTKYEKQ